MNGGEGRLDDLCYWIVVKTDYGYIVRNGNARLLKRRNASGSTEIIGYENTVGPFSQRQQLVDRLNTSLKA
jgi:hypothetical protein